MLGYVLRRVLSSGIVLIGILFIVFVVARLAPIDPVRYVLQQSGGIGGRIDPVEYEAMRRQLGLDRPILIQFIDYVKSVLSGDLGTSIVNPGRNVSDILGRGIPVSFQLALMGLGLQFLLGTLLGMLTAARQNSLFDRLAIGITTVFGAVPELVWGVLFIIIFAVQLQWLPVRGWDSPQHWLLPTFTIAISGLATYARFARSAILEQSHQDFVRTARAKGLPERTIVARHILRNALVPIVTFVGPSFAFLIAGNFVVETMFGVPGVAYYTITSTIQGDYPVVQATVLLVATMIMLFNLFIDVLYVLIDPRIRLT